MTQINVCTVMKVVFFLVSILVDIYSYSYVFYLAFKKMCLLTYCIPASVIAYSYPLPIFL